MSVINRPEISELCPFEKEVLGGLEDSNVVLSSLSKIGVAVSGGADSVSLLLSLVEIQKVIGFNLFVITINHNIREYEETFGDMQFVENLCKSIPGYGQTIICKTVEIEREKINSLAMERKGGIEEAARFVRYKEFSEFARDFSLDCICLGHNKNDQLETLLMRFLNGSGVEGLSGISQSRKINDSDFSYLIIRPLLKISRNDIERYLTSKNQSWRTDSTNADDSYLRNNVRKNLMPLLDKFFPMWQSGILSTREKLSLDAGSFEAELEKINANYSQSEISLSLLDFLALPLNLQIRFIFKAANQLGCNKRISFELVKQFCENLLQDDSCCIAFGGLKISTKKNFLFVKKTLKLPTDSVFFDIIEEDCDYLLPFSNSSVKIDSCRYNLEYPVCIRSFNSSDTVRTADGKEKHIRDIFSDWKVPEEIRSSIPVVQELKGKNQAIKCIFGEVAGFKNWIVK